MSSTVSDVQKIVVTLSEPDVMIEPGGVAKLVVTMINRQEIPDRLLVEVEGIDIEWYNIPVSAVNLAPGAQVEGRINFKVARNSENRAGSYPFVVRVQAMETGEVGFAQAMLIVKPYDALQVELQPKRAAATFLRPLNDFEVVISNLGNAEETVELHASDPDDDCAYEFDMDRLTLKPGQTEAVLLAIRPKMSAWIGNLRLYSFSVSARSVEDSYISGKAQGQLERHALISPLLGIFLLLLTFGSLGYFLFRPAPLKPVKLIAFTVSPTTTAPGQQVLLSWNVQGDRPAFTLKHTLGKEGVEVFDKPPTESSGNMPETIDAQAAGQTVYYTLEVSGPGSKTVSQTRAIAISKPPPVPKAVIRSFKADTNEIHQGEQVLLQWDAKGAVKYVLDPDGVKLTNIDETYRVTPSPSSLDQAVTYRLRAYGRDPNMPPDEKTLQVKVVPPGTCIASIDRFVVASKQVYIGDRARLRWSVSRADAITVADAQGQVVGSGLPAAGSLEVTVNQPTTFTLTATDNKSNTTTQQVTVTPQQRPAPPPQPESQPPSQGPATSGAIPPQDGATPPPPGGVQQPGRP